MGPQGSRAVHTVLLGAGHCRSPARSVHRLSTSYRASFASSVGILLIPQISTAFPMGSAFPETTILISSLRERLAEDLASADRSFRSWQDSANQLLGDLSKALRDAYNKAQARAGDGPCLCIAGPVCISPVVHPRAA